MSHPLQEDLVAYRDSELSASKRVQIAVHLRSCVACTQESAQLGRVEEALASLERVSLSPDFAATFWKRLEQEGRRAPEILDERASRWWRIWEFEWLTNWQIGSAVAAAASLLIVVGYFFSGSFISQRSTYLTPTTPLGEQVPLAGQALSARPNIPTRVQQEPQLFIDYAILASLDKFSYFDEIPTFPYMEGIGGGPSGLDIPSALREDPNFFMHYQLLKKMEQLQHLESVLDASGNGGASQHS